MRGLPCPLSSSVLTTPGILVLSRISGGGEEVGGVGGIVEIEGIPRFRLGEVKWEALIESMVGDFLYRMLVEQGGTEV